MRPHSGTDDPGGALTGRSFLSVRLAVRSMTERWERAAARLDRHEQRAGRELARIARQHSSEAFFGCDTVLEAGVFSSLLEICRDLPGGDDHVDP